ncbi:MAG TPA: ABC transporter substrate-binding protein, partial [Caulobacteraceae bacterium]
MKSPILIVAPLLAAVIAASLIGVPAARAASSDPAVSQIEGFDRALLEAMKDGRALGPKGRYAKLAPAVEHAFDLPLMTRFAVGPAWTTMSPADHQALVAA